MRRNLFDTLKSHGVSFSIPSISRINNWGIFINPFSALSVTEGVNNYSIFTLSVNASVNINHLLNPHVAQILSTVLICSSNNLYVGRALD